MQEIKNRDYSEGVLKALRMPGKALQAVTGGWKAKISL